MKHDVQVYVSNNITPRLTYAIDLVLGNLLGLSYNITDSPEEGIPLINYSVNRETGGIFIQPEPLLFEQGIRKQDIWVALYEDIPLFFQQPPEAGFFLDIFAFAFYMATRYEEYLTAVRDEHGRFTAESSQAYKHDFLKMPVVDIWAKRLGRVLELMYPGLKIPPKEYKHILTVDLDQPFAYRGKGFLRNTAGLLADIIHGRKPARRFGCMTGQEKDPYDTYSYINSAAEKYNTPVLYFFTAGKRSRFDKNTNPRRRCYRQLIRELSSGYDTGLHTSYRSGNSLKLILKEKHKIESVSNREVTRVRKHFLLLTIPLTYQVLQSTGIKEDYTLGYIREAGFRAGIARPYRFYDLIREEASTLTLVPFQYMDGTFQKYKRFSPEEAESEVDTLIRATKEVGGLFVSIWHNTSLTGEGEWKGWKKLFEHTLKEQQK